MIDESWGAAYRVASRGQQDQKGMVCKKGLEPDLLQTYLPAALLLMRSRKGGSGQASPCAWPPGQPLRQTWGREAGCLSWSLAGLTLPCPPSGWLKVSQNGGQMLCADAASAYLGEQRARPSSLAALVDARQCSSDSAPQVGCCPAITCQWLAWVISAAGLLYYLPQAAMDRLIHVGIE